MGKFYNTLRYIILVIISWLLIENIILFKDKVLTNCGVLCFDTFPLVRFLKVMGIILIIIYIFINPKKD